MKLEWENKIKQKDLTYDTNIYGIQQFETRRCFDDNIYTGKISINEVEMDQANLQENMIEFNNKSRPKTKKGKYKKRDTFDRASALCERRESTLNAFRSGIFQKKKKTKNIDSQTNVSKITNSSCTSKSR